MDIERFKKLRDKYAMVGVGYTPQGRVASKVE